MQICDFLRHVPSLSVHSVCVPLSKEFVVQTPKLDYLLYAHYSSVPTQEFPYVGAPKTDWVFFYCVSPLSKQIEFAEFVRKSPYPRVCTYQIIWLMPTVSAGNVIWRHQEIQIEFFLSQNCFSIFARFLQQGHIRATTPARKFLGYWNSIRWAQRFEFNLDVDSRTWSQYNRLTRNSSGIFGIAEYIFIITK